MQTIGPVFFRLDDEVAVSRSSRTEIATDITLVTILELIIAREEDERTITTEPNFCEIMIKRTR